MKELIDKYRNEKLTPSELSELREKLKSSSNIEVEEQLFDLWFGDDIDTADVSDEQMDKIKRVIDTRIRKKHRIFPQIIRWSQVAAAILLPVFIFLSIYLFQEKQQIMAAGEMVVSTGKFERANITLPDGSIVSLNTESRLLYHPLTFNKRERTINFSGEGHFQVARSETSPFIIYAKGLRVEVLGTVFNLSVRETNYAAILSLEAGSVLLTSTQSNESIVLHQNQKATLNHATGKITLITKDHITDMSAWRRNAMVFRNAKLLDVIRAIETNYGITIHAANDIDLSDKFSGTLPLNNIHEALFIIERSYHLISTATHNEIRLTAR